MFSKKIFLIILARILLVFASGASLFAMEPAPLNPSPSHVVSSAQRCARLIQKWRETRLVPDTFNDIDANIRIADDMITILRLDEDEVQELTFELRNTPPFNVSKMLTFFEERKEQCGLEKHLRDSAEGDNEELENCLIRSVNVNATDKQGRTALLLAAGAWNTQGVTLLLKYGAHVNARDDNQDSALEYALNASTYFAPPEALMQMLKPTAARRSTY